MYSAGQQDSVLFLAVSNFKNWAHSFTERPMTHYSDKYLWQITLSKENLKTKLTYPIPTGLGVHR